MLVGTTLLAASAAFAPSGALRVADASTARAAIHPSMQFKSMQSTDTAAAEQADRAKAAGMTPAEYEEATRQAAKAHLQTIGLHADGAAGNGVQSPEFVRKMWGVPSVPAVPEASLADPGRVIATVYEIGGPLTGVLSGSVAKQLPLIPHIGIRCHGTEYFYSDHIEYRTVPVMEEMLGDRPQVSIDLGPAAQSEEEVRATLAELDAEWEAKDYHVFDKNCVHFAGVLADRVCKKDDAIEPKLLQGVLDVSERMLDSLPEWRRALGRRVMNEVTRLVVVSWGKASQEKKEATADKLGVSRGE